MLFLPYHRSTALIKTHNKCYNNVPHGTGYCPYWYPAAVLIIMMFFFWGGMANVVRLRLFSIFSQEEKQTKTTAAATR